MGGARAPAADRHGPQTVTDGGTLRWQRIRLHSLDAPELRQACDGGIWPAGKVARDARPMGDWPVMFGSRLSLIEEWLRKRSEFSVFDPMELGLFTAIKEDQELRDMLVHGIAAEYDQERDAIRFHRIDRIKKAKRKPGRPSHRVHRLTVRFSTLREAARRLVAINRSLINLCESARSL
jgi:hypothetical protein